MSELHITSATVRPGKIHKSSSPDHKDQVEHAVDVELSNGRIFSISVLIPVDPNCSPRSISIEAAEYAKNIVHRLIGELPQHVKISYDSLSPGDPSDPRVFVPANVQKMAPRGSMLRRVELNKKHEEAIAKIEEEGLPKA